MFRSEYHAPYLACPCIIAVSTCIIAINISVLHTVIHKVIGIMHSYLSINFDMSIMPCIMPYIEYHHMSIIPKIFILYDADIDSIGITSIRITGQ